MRQLQASELVPTNMAANAPAHYDESGPGQQTCLQTWQLKPFGHSKYKQPKAEKAPTNMAAKNLDDTSYICQGNTNADKHNIYNCRPLNNTIRSCLRQPDAHKYSMSFLLRMQA